VTLNSPTPWNSNGFLWSCYTFSTRLNAERQLPSMPVNRATVTVALLSSARSRRRTRRGRSRIAGRLLSPSEPDRAVHRKRRQTRSVNEGIQRKPILTPDSRRETPCIAREAIARFSHFCSSYRAGHPFTEYAGRLPPVFYAGYPLERRYGRRRTPRPECFCRRVPPRYSRHHFATIAPGGSRPHSIRSRCNTPG
jgi:hypothetical protein